MSEKEITLDLETQTYVEEKTKRIRKVPCSDKMLENWAKGREKKKTIVRREKELENLYQEKEELKKEKEEFDKLKKTNFEVDEVKKP